MKRIFYLVLITGTATLFSISSCKKESLYPANSISTYNNPGQVAYTAELQANDWVEDANGIFVHTFQGVVDPGAPVKVYLLADDNEQQINNYIIFMDGQLWARAEDTDLKIYYRCSGPLPFSSLTIKMVIE